MSALPLPLPRPELRLVRSLPTSRAGATVAPTAVVTPSQARAWVVEALRLVAFSVDAGASPAAAQEDKDDVLRSLVEQAAARAETAPEMVATAIAVVTVDIPLAAGRVVSVLAPLLSDEDRASVLRSLADTEWPQGLPWALAPGVALAYGARVLDDEATAAQLTALRRRRLVHRAVSRAVQARHLRSVATAAVRPVAQTEPVWRRPGEAVLPGVLYVPLAAQFAAQRAAGTNPFTVLPSPGSAAAS